MDLSLGHGTRTFRTYLGMEHFAPAELCFSLCFVDRTVDLVAETHAQRDLWTQGIGYFARLAKHVSTRLITINEERCLFEACYHRDCEALRAVLNRGMVDVDALEPTADGNGDSVLIIAARHGYTDVVDLCLQFGAVNDPHPGHGQTALHAAVQHGHVDVSKLLLDTAAITQVNDVIANHADADSFTPLHIACYYGQSSLVQLLIEHGAELSLVDCYGQTCVHTTAASSLSSSTRILEILLSIGGDEFIDVGDSTGNTCLHLAAGVGNECTLKYLLQSGANPCLTNYEGFKPYELAIRFGSPECMALLREYEAWQISQSQSWVNPSRNYTVSANFDYRVPTGKTLQQQSSRIGERIRAELYHARRVQGNTRTNQDNFSGIGRTRSPADNLRLHIEQTRENWGQGDVNSIPQLCYGVDTGTKHTIALRAAELQVATCRVVI